MNCRLTSPLMTLSPAIPADRARSMAARQKGCSPKGPRHGRRQVRFVVQETARRGRGTAWLAWWADCFPLVVFRREAHELINGRVPDDRAAFARVRSAMGDLIDDRDSPTWAYDLALKLEPGNNTFRSALAARLLTLGRLAEAEPHFAAMVEGKAKEPRTWVDRGMLLAQAGQPERAAADFARALALVPQDIQVPFTRVRCSPPSLPPSP